MISRLLATASFSLRMARLVRYVNDSTVYQLFIVLSTLTHLPHLLNTKDTADCLERYKEGSFKCVSV